MFVLVTQADGSARRIPLLTMALVGFLLYAYGAWNAAGGVAQATAAAAREEVLAQFEAHPYVEVRGPAHFMIAADYAASLQETYFEEREDMGLPPLSMFLVEDAQEDFDALVAEAVAAEHELPAWHLGIGSGPPPAQNYLLHVGLHRAQIALVLAIVLLLCVGMPLEDGWGPVLFGLFVAASVALTGAASQFAGYSEALGQPWVGAGGLVAALLGAYFVRSLRGGARLAGLIPMPGWLLLSGWAAVEYLVVRQVGSGQPLSTPTVMVHAVGFGFGATTSVLLWMIGFERKMIDRAADTPELVSNPALEQAMQAREKGEHERAFEVLQKEFQRVPDNPDVAVAFWDTAVSLGQGQQATDAVLLVIRNDLKLGNGDQAVRNWFALGDSGANPVVDAPLCVRIGEALLDEGHPDEAIRALERAVSAKKPLPTAMAQRVVRIARDLDPELTHRAAAIALADERLGPAERDELTRLSDEVMAEAPRNAPKTAPPLEARPEPVAASPQPEMAPPLASPLPEAAAEPESEPFSLPPVAPAAPPQPPVEEVAADEFGVRSDLEVNSADAEALSLEIDADTSSEASWDDADVADLDPQALSLDALEEDFSKGLDEAEAESWNSPGEVPDLSNELDDDLGDIDDSELEAAAAEAGLLDELPDIDQALPGEPLRSDRVGEDTTITEVDVSVAGEDTATEVDTQPCLDVSVAEAATRDLRVRTAAPLSLDGEGLRLDVDGSGKTRLPFARIEGLAVAAVKGLSKKPVLVVDLVLNPDALGEALKIIRLPSDGFDPRSLVSGGDSPLDALRKLLATILERSGARPLPNAAAVTGSPFIVFDDVEAYQREVLGASNRVG